MLEFLHLTQTGSWGMITIGQYTFWPYIHFENLNKAAKCILCTEIGKNLEAVIPASKYEPFVNCSEPNEDIQLDFGGLITSQKDQDIRFLACIDRFSKYSTMAIFDKANEINVVKVLDKNIQILEFLEILD